MSYYFNTILTGTNFEDAIEQVTAELKKEGFGIVTEIDVKQTFKTKIDVDFRNYKILGACNPHFAHAALCAEPKIGVFLPCNVIVEENENGQIEVSAVDPVASMMAVENLDLPGLAEEVRQKLQNVINNLK
ncbi:MAG: DUF302 domain-containing protein [Bacteroidota bacterium]